MTCWHNRVLILQNGCADGSNDFNGLVAGSFEYFSVVCLYGCYHPLNVTPGVGMHTLFKRYFCTFVPREHKLHFYFYL